MLGIAPGVQHLHQNLAALGVHPIDDQAMPRIALASPERGRAETEPAFRVGGDAAGDDQADVAPGPLGIEGDEALEATFGFLEAGMHRAHDDPVPELREAQIQRGQETGMRRRHEVSSGE